MTRERRLELAIAGLFGVAGLAGVALLGLYILGGQTQLEAVLLAVCLGGIGVGIVVWAQRLLPNEVTIEERGSHEPTAPAKPVVREDPAAHGSITRRSLLMRTLGLAFGGLAAALAVPVLSLGPAPNASRFHTPWRAGLRLVGLDGQPVTANDVPIDGVMTVFPEGLPGSANGQTVLIHVTPDLLRLPADRASWAPDGFVAYSKLCTHAGCPVGLYRAGEHRLICPCHQSTFDVLDGAVPSFGPAARPLPQLPIRLEADGTFTALGDFPEPVGPSFWDMSHGG
jgi:ubiquinol-cytochrome c reductase iron-sulfur subunit